MSILLASGPIGAGLRLHSLEELLVLADVLIDLLAVIMVIRLRRVNVGQRKLGKIRDNLIRRPAFLGPQNDILNADTMAHNARFATAHTRSDLNVGGTSD